MAGGVDQTMANKVLTLLNTGANGPSITTPIHMRFMTANGSDASAGTELTTGSGYTQGTGAPSVSSFAAASAGSQASSAAVSVTNMPSCTLTGMEQWDSSGTPQRTFWAPWLAGSIVVGSGNTFTVASGSLTDSLA
jgi:hypothetical protein